MFIRRHGSTGVAIALFAFGCAPAPVAFPGGGADATADLPMAAARDVPTLPDVFDAGLAGDAPTDRTPSNDTPAPDRLLADAADERN